MNNLPKVVTQQRRGRASNPRLLDRKSDALPLSHRATPRGRSRSLQMVGYHSKASHPIVTMALSCIISKIKRDIGRKSRFFHIPAMHSTPPLGGFRRNIAIPFGTEKLKWWGYQTVKMFDDTFSRFDKIPACEGETDRRTDVLRRHSPRYA